MIHMQTAEPKSSAKSKMALHLLIAAQREMHWKTRTHTLKHRHTKSSCMLGVECPLDFHRSEPVVLISSRYLK